VRCSTDSPFACAMGQRPLAGSAIKARALDQVAVPSARRGISFALCPPRIRWPAPLTARHLANRTGDGVDAAAQHTDVQRPPCH
jgi:hypothetical protein